MNIDNKYLKETAEALGVPVQWLWNIIQFESKWNPLAVASQPYNKYRLSTGSDISPKYAKGLIQFIDTTAQELGYTDSLDLISKNPTAEQQLLFPVRQYFEKYKPFPTEQSFYLTVFYPAARNWPLNREFPEAVKAGNPGIVTVNDYVKKVRSVEGLGKENILVILGISGILLYFLLRK